MHFLCRELSSTRWGDPGYLSPITEKIKQCSTGHSVNNWSGLGNLYGPPHRPGYQCKMHHPIIWSHGLIKCCSDKHHIRPFALPVSITWSIIRSPCFPWKLSPTLDQQFHFTWLACPLSSRSIEQRSMPIWFSPLLYGVCLEVGDYLEGNNHTV